MTHYSFIFTCSLFKFAIDSGWKDSSTVMRFVVYSHLYFDFPSNMLGVPIELAFFCCFSLRYFPLPPFSSCHNRVPLDRPVWTSRFVIMRLILFVFATLILMILYDRCNCVNLCMVTQKIPLFAYLSSKNQSNKNLAWKEYNNFFKMSAKFKIHRLIFAIFSPISTFMIYRGEFSKFYLKLMKRSPHFFWVEW